MRLEWSERALLFWGVCIPVRATLASLGNNALLRVFALGVGANWLLGFSDGHVGAFGGSAFWKEERPVHGALWTAYALTGRSGFLWFDTAFGALNWVVG